MRQSFSHSLSDTRRAGLSCLAARVMHLFTLLWNICKFLQTTSVLHSARLNTACPHRTSHASPSSSSLSSPQLTPRWSRFATNINAGTVTRLDIDILAAPGTDDSWRALLVPFVGVTHLVVHPIASMAAVLCALLPIAPYDWSRRLLPRVSHIEMTQPNANAFFTVQKIVRDRLQLARAGTAWISAVVQVDIYDYDSGAFLTLEWIELSRLLEEARGFF